MESWSHPNPQAAVPGEIVGIYPFELSPEESELVANHLLAAERDFPISHYMKEKYFIQLLESEALSAQRLDLYRDDALEGLYPEANQHDDPQFIQRMNAMRDRPAFLKSQEIHRTHCYAHCWFGIPQETAAMWEDYGDEGKGVCIVSSTHRLQRAVFSEPNIAYELGKVTYWPEDKQLPDLHSSTVMFRKQPKFSDENEVRLLCQIKMEHLPKDSEGFLLPCPERLTVRIDLSMLIAGIILGPSMLSESQQKLIESAHAKIPQAKVLRSRFDMRP